MKQIASSISLLFATFLKFFLHLAYSHILWSLSQVWSLYPVPGWASCWGATSSRNWSSVPESQPSWPWSAAGCLCSAFPHSSLWAVRALIWEASTYPTLLGKDKCTNRQKWLWLQPKEGWIDANRDTLIPWFPFLFFPCSSLKYHHTGSLSSYVSTQKCQFLH